MSCKFCKFPRPQSCGEVTRKLWSYGLWFFIAFLRCATQLYRSCKNNNNTFAEKPSKLTSIDFLSAQSSFVVVFGHDGKAFETDCPGTPYIIYIYAPAPMQPPLVPGVAAAGEVQMVAVQPRMPEVVDTGTDGSGEYAAAVPRDPYMLSPGNPLPAGAVPSPSQHYKGADGTRLAVKTRPRAQPPPLGSVPLGEKLEAKRHALAPFGLPNLGAGPPGDEAAMSDAATSTSANPYMSEAEIQRRLAGFAGVQSHTLIADDDDGPTTQSS